MIRRLLRSGRCNIIWQITPTKKTEDKTMASVQTFYFHLTHMTSNTIFPLQVRMYNKLYLESEGSKQL